MIGRREFKIGIGVWSSHLRVAGCSSVASPVKGAKTSAQSPVGEDRQRRAAAVAGRPHEVARAPLGTLSASKWRFANGLLAVLMPDASATSIAYTTWFRVGSRDEDEAAGQTGLAHLFEHLMFTQTKAGADGAFDRALEEVGGNTNAMTYYDFTAYIDSVPPGELARIAGMEADRMVNLTLDKRQVDTERDVVAEERLGSVEDSVDGSLDELMYKQSFRTHPYRWPILGWMKDIKAVTEAKAVAFYRRFYNPANAIVVISGRIDEAATLDVLARSYGGLPAAPELPRAVAAPEHAPAEDVRATLVRPVLADRLVVGYPAPGLADADRVAFELVNEILLGGPSSRIYRRLVIERELASSARGDVAPTRDPGLYGIWVQLTKGHTAAEAEAVIVEEIAALGQRADSGRRARQGQGAPRDRVLARAHLEPRPRRDAGPVRDRLRRLSPPVPARRPVRARNGGRRARDGRRATSPGRARWWSRRRRQPPPGGGVGGQRPAKAAGVEDSIVRVIRVATNLPRSCPLFIGCWR